MFRYYYMPLDCIMEDLVINFDWDVAKKASGRPKPQIMEASDSEILTTPSFKTPGRFVSMATSDSDAPRRHPRGRPAYDGRAHRCTEFGRMPPAWHRRTAPRAPAEPAYRQTNDPLRATSPAWCVLIPTIRSSGPAILHFLSHSSKFTPHSPLSGFLQIPVDRLARFDVRLTRFHCRS
jgi:hypothetical protein